MRSRAKRVVYFIGSYIGSVGLFVSILIFVLDRGGVDVVLSDPARMYTPKTTSVSPDVNHSI